MAGERVEVGPDRLDVNRHVGNGLRPVDEHERPGVVGHPRQLLDRVDRAERVADVGERDELRLELEQHLEHVEAQHAVIGDRDELEVAVLLLDEELPRNEVRVVLHLGEHDHVAAADRLATPRVRHEVDRLGGVAREDDLVRVRRADEPRDLGARLLVGRCRSLADLVDPAMDVGVVLAVELVDRVDDDLRLLARGRRVEVDERLAVDLRAQDREVGPQRVRIDRLRRLRGEGHPRPPAAPPTSTGSSSGDWGTWSASSGASIDRPASRRIGP